MLHICWHSSDISLPHSSLGTTTSSNLASIDSNNLSLKSCHQNGGVSKISTFSRKPHSTNIMDVIEILDDDHHISIHLSYLMIIQHNNPNGSNTLSYERLEFYQSCKCMGVIPTEVLYTPKSPQEATYSASELVSWNTHIHNTELDLRGQLISSMKCQSATLVK